MKKLIGSLLVLAVVVFNVQSQERWNEGTHYTVISDTASSDKKITEFFSYWCPACYAFEPVVADVKSKLSPDVKIEKVHVDFMRFAEPEVQEGLTKAMIAGKVMGKEDLVHSGIFNYLHKDRKRIVSLSDIPAVMQSIGVSEADFTKASKSFAANGQIKKNNKTIQKYRKHLNGVPNFIINEKYLVTIQRGMTPNDIADLMVYLSQKS